MKKNIVRRRKITALALVASICVASVFLAVTRCARLIRANYLEQLEQNLADVSNQNADTLKSQMEFRYSLLESVAQRFNLEPENRKENIYMFKPVAESFHLKRIGFCDETGMAYATSGEITDLSSRSFFKRGMKGESCITLIEKDLMDEAQDQLTIMSMPIYDSDHNINGIAGITYVTDTFSDELAIKSFEGHGNTFILNEAGTIVISSAPEIADTNENMYDLLWKEVNTEEKYLIRKDYIDEKFGLEKIEKNNGTIKLNGEDYYYHVTMVPLLNDSTIWSILSMVPAAYLQDRFNPTRTNLLRMMAIVIISGCIVIVTIRIVSGKQRKLSYSLAFNSSVTKGPNLAYMNLILARNHVDAGFLVACRIENFRHTSVAIGKSKTEDILKKVWEVFKKDETNDDFYCHDKDDSFVLYFGTTSDAALKKRLITMTRQIQTEAQSINLAWVKPKFGIYCIKNQEAPEDVCRKAELAVQEALVSENFYAFYDDEKQKSQIEMQKLEGHFKQALVNKEFLIYFQPKYDTSHKKLSGSEALVRWNFKGEGLVSPVKFIPLLEKNGRINRLDEYIFRTVCEYQGAWKKAGLPIVPVSVNISKASLFRAHIVEHYCDIIARAGLLPEDIQLEVTETLVSSGGDLAELLNKFREKGIKVLMDDFGTGYTALSTLNFKCFDTLKMDKSLIDGINDQYGRQLLSGVIEMTKKLGYHITAEGVEEEYQFDFLKSIQCDDIQGFYFSRPVPAADYESLLNS